MRKAALAAALIAISAPAAASTCRGSGDGAPQFIHTASGSGTASQVTATLTAPTGGLAWNVTQIEISGNSATSGTQVLATLTGIRGADGNAATMNIAVPVGALATPGVPVNIMFPCALTGVPNTAIVLTVPSFGPGNPAASATVHGFLQ